MPRLSNYEKETIITFNEGDSKASIFTYSRAWQNHLEKKIGLKPVDNGHGGREYEIDKERIPKPRAPRQLSAATRKKLSEDMKTRILRSATQVTNRKSEDERQK